MEHEYVTRNEYEEHSKRMEDEHVRMNHRIGYLEKFFEENNKLLIAVEKLALNMEKMQKELETQNGRVEELEARDGETWRKMKWYVLTTVVGLVLGYVFSNIGI